MHLEVLDKKRQAVIPDLAKFKGFYLAGGTALALQIGHRISVDFDLFSHRPIAKKLLSQAESVFGVDKARVLINNIDELTLITGGVKVTFLHYPFKVLLKKARFKGLDLLSAREIGVTKAYTIGRRGSYKDYVDIYFLLQNGIVTLDEIMRMSKAKYKNEFNARLFLEQLVYFKDIKDTGVRFIGKRVGLKELGKFFMSEVKKVRI